MGNDLSILGPVTQSRTPAGPADPLSAARRRPLLELDTELGAYLPAERRAAAGRQLRVPVAALRGGPCQPRLLLGPSPANVGLLVLKGLIAREVMLRDTASAELLGPGDIIRTAPTDVETGSVEAPVRWTALRPVHVALLDARAATALSAFPEVMMVVLDRLTARAQRLGLTQAISQLTGVERRLESLFWHLADRWGRVTPEGVVVPMHLSHRLLGSLVGAKRPTVSTALARLAHEGRVHPRPEGGWVLTAAPPAPPRAETFERHRLRFASAARRR